MSDIRIDKFLISEIESVCNSKCLIAKGLSFEMSEIRNAWDSKYLGFKMSETWNFWDSKYQNF